MFRCSDTNGSSSYLVSLSAFLGPNKSSVLEPSHCWSAFLDAQRRGSINQVLLLMLKSPAEENYVLSFRHGLVAIFKFNKKSFLFWISKYFSF